MSTNTALLTSLTQTVIDSVEGYRLAAEHASSPRLKQILHEAHNKRRKIVDKLNGELSWLGEETVDKGSAAGSMHRAWVNISTAFQDGDKAAAKRVEEGEDYIKEKFEKALERKDWDIRTRQALEEAFAEIREGERLTDQLEKEYD